MASRTPLRGVAEARGTTARVEGRRQERPRRSPWRLADASCAEIGGYAWFPQRDDYATAAPVICSNCLVQTAAADHRPTPAPQPRQPTHPSSSGNRRMHLAYVLKNNSFLRRRIVAAGTLSPQHNPGASYVLQTRLITKCLRVVTARGFVSHNGRVRLLGYTRVSTSSQDAQLQFDALVAAGVQKRDVFADVTSGTKTAIERRGMKKLLEHAESGDTVVVWRVDRLGRSLIDVLNTVNLLRERGVHVRSISDGIDPTTSTGRLMLNMLATLAEYERELIVERVNAGIAAARHNGTRFGRPPSDPAVIADKLAIAADARAKGRTAEDAARLVGWSRATLYRHQQALAGRESAAM